MQTIDNIRRTLSSFFAWLENEDYIVKSPVRRIHKVKATKKISDMNFQERSCIILDKGNIEREVYFSAKSKMYIKKYLEIKTDDNEALFVSLIKPYN